MTRRLDLELLYRDRFRSQFAEEFQSWFERLVRSLHPAGDFQAVRKTSGDGGLDGYVISSQLVYQVFAPRRPSDHRDSATAAKIIAGFWRAKETIPELRTWVFVDNDPEGKLGQRSIAAINRLKTQDPNIEIIVLGIDSLWRKLCALEDDVLEIILKSDLRHYEEHGQRVFSGVPAKDSNFVGRDDELSMIATCGSLETLAESIAVTVVVGLPGLGKTSLATQFAHENAKRYSGVLWVSAETRKGLIANLAGRADVVGVDLSRDAGEEELAHAVLARISDLGSWLLIYDSIEEPSILDELCPSRKVHVLLTTRWSDWSGRGTTLNLEVFPPVIAEQFLLNRASASGGEGVRSLSRMLGYLPLALDHAGAYCRRSGIGFRSYEEKLRIRLRNAPRGARYPTSVFGTFKMALDAVAPPGSIASRLMSLVSVMAPERIPIQILLGNDTCGGEVDAGISALTEVSLLRLELFDDGAPAILAHRLVQLAMVDQLSDGEMRREVLREAASLILRWFPEKGDRQRPVSWGRCARLLPHAQEVVDRWVKEKIASQEISELGLALANYLHARGDYHSAEKQYKQSIEFLVEGSEDSRDLGIRLNDLGLLLLELGRYEEAERHLRSAVSMGRRLLGFDDGDLLVWLNNLALLLSETGRNDDAELVYKEVIPLGVARFGNDSWHIPTWRNNYALMLLRTRRFIEAERILRELCDIEEDATGRTDTTYATWKNNLGLVLRDTGRLDEAGKVFREAIELYSSAQGDSHPVTARFQANYGEVLLRVGKAEEAQDFAQAAAEVLVQRLGEKHPWTISARDLNRRAVAACSLDLSSNSCC